MRRLLEPPRASFAADLAVAASGGLPVDAAERVARFSDRIADLSPEERRELFDETFGRSQTDADRQRLVFLLEQSLPPAASSELWKLIDRLGAVMMRDGNPYHHLIAAVAALASPR
jgi:nitrate reductase assembly molybdenum cofactor insertion protein NarJ